MPITCIPYPVSPNVAAKTTVSSSTAVTYTVPAGSTGIYVYLWGGAGGYGNQPNGMGGSGGFVSGFYSCSAGTILSVILGSAGGSGGGAGQGTILTGGGSGGGGSFCVGGGFAGIFNSTTTAAASQANAIAIAGGGGGSGQYGSANGGGGGYPSGTAAIINAYGGNASGGTQSGPGTGDGGTGTGMIGSNGGGGGYFGGGGTAFGGGGGGSSYIGGFTSLAYYENGSNATAYNQATPVYPGGRTNTYYVSPAGQALNSSFNIGLVVIIPATAVTPTGNAPTRIPLTLTVYPSRTINSYTGNYILYTVPAGITSLIFNMWGAGGPGGGGGMVGGGGAYLTGTLATTPGEQLRIIVGYGGLYGTSNYINTLPDYQGAGGGGGGLAGNGGQGGGRSAIQKYIAGSWTEIVTAGGGGSAGGNAGTYGGNAYYTGTSQSAGTTYGQGRIPTGGSASAGGLGTFTANTGAPYNGTQFTGGAASNAYNVSPVTGPCGGGGGGGGYYGGGGGGRSGADTYGGGGGSSYYNATYVTNFSGSNGNGTTQIASTIPGYMTNIGTGGLGNSSSSGNNGLVIFNVAYTKTQAVVVPFPPIYTYFAYTGSNQTYTVPAGVTTITVYIWGAGGGQGSQTPTQEYGGAGAYVTGSLTVTPGSTFIVLVGGGGYTQGGATAGQGGFGGGGNSAQQAGGGGRSAIQRTLTATISSASGNGSVVTYTTSAAHGLAVGQPVIITGLTPAGYNGTYIVASVASTTFTASNTTSGTSSGTGTIVAELADAGGGGGGAGWAAAAGGAAAWTGTASDGTSPGGGVNGKGATQTAGGAATSGSQGESFAGTALQGGAQTYQGGAGGGGYYGGGAGAGNAYNHGGGGGGSSYTALLTGATGQNGSGGVPPTTGFTNLPANTAAGGQLSSFVSGTKGGDGYVIISYPRTT